MTDEKDEGFEKKIGVFDQEQEEDVSDGSDDEGVVLDEDVEDVEEE